MKKLLLTITGFFLAALSLIAAEAKTVLSISQKSPVPIVIPAKVSEADRNAARELRDYIAKITGAKIRILNEKRAPKGTAIYIGETEFAALSWDTGFGKNWKLNVQQFAVYDTWADYP